MDEIDSTMCDLLVVPPSLLLCSSLINPVDPVDVADSFKDRSSVYRRNSHFPFPLVESSDQGYRIMSQPYQYRCLHNVSPRTRNSGVKGSRDHLDEW